MSVPGIVQSRLDGEQVAAEVSLGGEDGLYVTRTRTLIYRGDGLLSDESVEEYPHDAERIEISEGRRKSAVRLDYGIDGTEKFKVPSNRLYEALHPVLAGVLNAADVTAPDETVKQTYQFSELTLVITSERVVKHVGAAVWDEDYEEFHFDEVTALEVEEGSVSSQIIIESDGRPQRIKTPSDQTREVRERIERALLDHHDLRSYEAFVDLQVDDEESGDDGDAPEAAENDPDDGDEEADPLATGGVDPIDADPPELDDDGAIVEDDASVTTGERSGDDVSPAEASEVAAKAAEATAGGEVAESAEPSDAAAADVEAAQRTEADDGTAAPDAETDSEQAGDSRAEQTTDETTDGFAESGFQPASSELERDETDEQLAALTEAVERQNELLAQQQRTLEQLIEELRRGR